MCMSARTWQMHQEGASAACGCRTQVAAAVGMRLPLELLAAVHPLVDAPAALQGDLRGLAAAQFLRLDAGDGCWAWTQVRPPSRVPLGREYSSTAIQGTACCTATRRLWQNGTGKATVVPTNPLGHLMRTFCHHA